MVRGEIYRDCQRQSSLGMQMKYRVKINARDYGIQTLIHYRAAHRGASQGRSQTFHRYQAIPHLIYLVPLLSKIGGLMTQS